MISNSFNLYLQHQTVKFSLIVSNEGSYFEAETETPQSKSFKGMSEFNYFEEDLSFSNGQNWAQVDRAIKMAIDVVLKEKTPPEQDGTSRFKEWLESDQIIQTVRRPFFTPAFWIAVIFSLLLIALLGSAWQFAGTRTLNNWAFGNKEFVPGRDSLLSNGWIKEQWVVDSGLVYHNQGVTVGNVDRREMQSSKKQILYLQRLKNSGILILFMDF